MKKLVVIALTAVGLFAYLMVALLLPSRGPRLVLTNNGRVPISNVEISYTGGSYTLPHLAPGETWQDYLRATGESHVEIRWQWDNGREQAHTIGAYFEAGYAGKLTVNIEEDTLVSLDHITLPPVFNWCLNLFCP